MNLTMILLPGWATVHAGSHATASYQIRELIAPTGSRFYPEAINGGGTVAGHISSHGGSTVKAAVYAGHLIPLGAPSGFTDSAALGVSYMGGVLVQAWSLGHPSRRFVAEPYDSHYVWERLHSGIAGYVAQSIQAIDANGDVAGAIQRPGHLQSLRAVVWLHTSRGSYPRATLLPGLSHGSTTEADAIWSGGGRIVVAGVGQGPSFSQPVAELWTNAHGGTFRAGSDTVGLFASTIGGHGRHVYMIGTTDSGVANYGEPVSQEASPIVFTKNGNTSTRRLIDLVQSNRTWLGISGVASSGAIGGFVAVGRSASPSGGDPQAVIWRGLARTTVYGQRLQRLLPAQSPWILADAAGINRSGEIVGTGTFHGRYAAFLLMPPYVSRCSCY